MGTIWEGMQRNDILLSLVTYIPSLVAPKLCGSAIISGFNLRDFFIIISADCVQSTQSKTRLREWQNVQ